MTKPDFIAYNHKYYWTLSRQICKKLYRCLAVAWTVKSQKELEARRKDFDLFIFDSFIPAGTAAGGRGRKSMRSVGK